VKIRFSLVNTLGIIREENIEGELNYIPRIGEGVSFENSVYWRVETVVHRYHSGEIVICARIID
jgi:hypothetical protein